MLRSDQITIYTSEKETRNPEWQTAKWTMEQAKKAVLTTYVERNL
jgi:hypothetical protein